MRSTNISWDEQTSADAGRLWAGGAATALVAAIVALVGIKVLHDLLHAPIVTPGGLEQSAGYATVAFPISAAILTLLATGLLHLLMTTTPRASQFFGWIASLVLVLVVLQVFLHETDLLTQLEAAAFYLVIGIAIISSLMGVSRSAVRYHRRQAYQENRPPRGGAYGYSNEDSYGYSNQAPQAPYRDDPWR